MVNTKESAYTSISDADEEVEIPLLEHGRSSPRRIRDTSCKRLLCVKKLPLRHTLLAVALSILVLVIDVVLITQYKAALHSIKSLNAKHASSYQTIDMLNDKIANLDRTIETQATKIRSLTPDLLLDRANNARIGVASLRTGSGGRWGSGNNPIDRSIKTWTNYAKRWGYPVWQGNQVLAYGRPDNSMIYSKTALLLSIMLDEMRKPPGSRLEWLYATDADTLVLNPNVPLDTFLPPDTDFGRSQVVLFNFDAWDTVNGGAFFIRVSSQGMDYLAQTLAFKNFVPEDTWIPLAEQSVMTLLVHEAKYNWTDSVTITPPWFNKSSWNFKWPLDGESLFDNFMIHFAGDNKDHWTEVLEMIETGEAQKYIKPLENTQYMAGSNSTATWWQYWEAVDPAERRAETTILTESLAGHLREHSSTTWDWRPVLAKPAPTSSGVQSGR